MGEIADAMLNGELCEWCGSSLDGDSGYPRLCASCADKKKLMQMDEFDYIAHLKGQLDEAVGLLEKYCESVACDNCLFFDNSCQIDSILNRKEAP